MVDIGSMFEESFKESLGSVDERRETYSDLAYQMLNGIPLDEQEILVLTYGMKWDDEEARPIELEALIPQLARQEFMNPGSTQVEDIASGVERESMFTAKEQVFPFIGGPGKAAATGASAASKTGLFSSLRAGAAAHPVKTAIPLFAGGGLLAFSLNESNAEETYGTGDPVGEAEDTGSITTDTLADLTEEEYGQLEEALERRESQTRTDKLSWHARLRRRLKRSTLTDESE